MDWRSIENTLEAIPNPRSYHLPLGHRFLHVINMPEFTFLGVRGQPDFGSVLINFVGTDKAIELKSLKEYLFQYRDVVVSYERALTVIYSHLVERYSPCSLRVEVRLLPRGGIDSTLVAQTDDFAEVAQMYRS